MSLDQIRRPPAFQPGYDRLVTWETGGIKYYKPGPEVPPGSSGITLGVGVDLGYTPTVEIGNMFCWLVTGDQLQRLQGAQGKIKNEARAYLPKVQDVKIEWEQALYIFDRFTIPKFYRLAMQAFPMIEKASAAVQWSLLSLVFNRGPSLVGPRREEMRQIRQLLPAQSKSDQRQVANLIRKQVRIWIGTDLERGMKNRREAEARLIEEYLT